MLKTLLRVTSGVLLLLAVAAPQTPRTVPRHVVMVSIDGLRPDFYLDPRAHGATLPTLAALMARGAFAEEVVGTYPSVTYPSHTTLVTGVRPARHGIVSNHVFDPTGTFRDWFWYAKAIRAPTLWDAAKASGGTTAAVSWPVTVGAPVDFNFAELVKPGSRQTMREIMAEVMKPELLQEIEAEYGTLTNERFDGEPRESFTFDVARLLVRRYQPTLLLLHVYNTDSAEHRYGREGSEVVKAFEGADRKLAALVDTIEEMGLQDETLLVVTGDHGFADVHSTIRLNVAFREAGLLTVNSSGVVTDWRAMAWAGGGSCAVMVRERENPARVAEAERAVKSLLAGPLGGAMRIISRSELDALGAVPDAAFGLEATEGYHFGEGLSGEVLVPASDRGYHGYLPTGKMATGFIMVGPGVRKGIRVPTMRQIDVAPTIAAWAGWDLKDVEGTVLRGLFEVKP